MRQALLLARPSLVLALAAALAAQGAVVSPAGLVTVDGNSSNAYPRWGAGGNISRYMQIHSDLPQQPFLFKQLALRQDSGGVTFAGPAVIDVEVYMGSSVSWDRASWVYASNYVLAPTNVIPRTMLNIQNVSGGSTPNAFDMKFPFTTPFVYIPAFSVAWEVIAHGTSGPNTPGPDAHRGSIGTGGSEASVGNGCFATGQSTAMQLVTSSGSYGSAFSLGYYVDFGPANAPTVLAVGLTNPSLTFPGLCGQLYTDMLVTLGMGLTDATGFIGELFTTSSKGPGGSNALALPNTFPGATLYLQAHSIDAGSPNPVQVSSSNGRAVTVATPNLATVVQATRVYGFTVGLAATNPNAFYVPSSAGFAVVTQFTY